MFCFRCQCEVITSLLVAAIDHSQIISAVIDVRWRVSYYPMDWINPHCMQSNWDIVLTFLQRALSPYHSSIRNGNAFNNETKTFSNRTTLQQRLQFLSRLLLITYSIKLDQKGVAPNYNFLHLVQHPSDLQHLHRNFCIFTFLDLIQTIYFAMNN